MPIRQVIVLLFIFFGSVTLHAGGIESVLKPDIELEKDSKEGLDQVLNLDRLNPPVSAEEYKSTQLQLGNMDFISAEERTYYITAGDLIIIKLPNEELFQEYEVNFEGYITLPTLGNFKAEGLTIGELEKSIFFRLPVYLRQMNDVEVQIKQKKNMCRFLAMWNYQAGILLQRTLVFRVH